jgi:hypothetical protein
MCRKIRCDRYYSIFWVPSLGTKQARKENITTIFSIQYLGPSFTAGKEQSTRPQYRKLVFSFLLSLSPATGKKRAKRRRSGVPAAISPVALLSGHRLGAGREGWPGNRRADVDRLGFSFSRSRVCLSPVGGGARDCSPSFGGGAKVCPADVGEAEVPTALGNKVSRPSLRPNDASSSALAARSASYV